MSRELSWKIGFCLIVLFWGLVSFFDFPPPFIDDAWYIGASINLVRHGIFANPLCESLNTIGSGQHFYASMPLHSYVLAAWLWLFGISTLSFKVLYTSLALAVTLLTYALLPVSRLSCVAAFFVSLATYGLLAGAGYRPDSLGLVFVLLGLGLWRTNGVAASFAANLSFGFAVITLPTVAVIGMLTSIAVLIHRALFRREKPAALLPYVAATGAAYLVSFLIFLVCIQGHLTEFLASLHENERLTQLAIAGRFHLFSALGICKWLILQPIFLLVMLVLARSGLRQHQRGHLYFLGYVLTGFLWLAYSSLHSSTAGHVWGYACLIGILFVVLWKDWPWPVWIAYGILYPVAAFGHAHVAIQHLLADPMPPPAQLQEMRERVAALQARKLYLDEYAMRELYDYNLPGNAFDYEWCSTSGWSWPKSEADMPKDAVFVTSVSSAKPTKLDPDAGKDAQPLRIFGYPVPGVTKNPYQLEIFQTPP